MTLFGKTGRKGPPSTDKLFDRLFLLSPGQTIEQSWIPHATLLGVNVEVVAKHYPTLLDETFKFKLALNL